jgi:LysR family transcriptional regulator, glycine cleavage system transcriptional activator
VPKLPPLTELRAFEAAARHLSFKAAAEELGVTPTAISHQIRLLEQYCGHALFRRRPRPLALTWSGEQLFPVVRDGLDSFGTALAAVRAGAATGRLCVTATNAFSARLLVPRLPIWRKAFPRLRLSIVGTDAVLNLKAGEADVAIRYARTPPADLVAFELARDSFHVVGNPALVGRKHGARPLRELARLPLIEAEWPPTDFAAPTWERWEAAARVRHRAVPPFASLVALSFREELHAIEAVIAGQGIAICSDLLVGRELADGTLVTLSDVMLPGYGCFAAYRHGHPKERAIKTFVDWLRANIG